MTWHAEKAIALCSLAGFEIHEARATASFAMSLPPHKCHTSPRAPRLFHWGTVTVSEKTVLCFKNYLEKKDEDNEVISLLKEIINLLKENKNVTN